MRKRNRTTSLSDLFHALDRLLDSIDPDAEKVYPEDLRDVIGQARQQWAYNSLVQRRPRPMELDRG